MTPAIRWRRWTVATIAAILVLWQADGTAGTVTVTLRTDDGITLAASYYEPSHRPASGVILLPMLNRNRDDWQSVASRLADAGFAVIAIDARGQSPSAGALHGADDRLDAARRILDVRAARRFLASRSEVSQTIGIGGASVGANVALLAAADDATIRSVALLSPGLDYLGLKTEAAMRRYADRPALLIAGANDPYALRSIGELAKIGPGVRDVRTIEAGGHGTMMLARSPDLATELVDWFQRTLL